MNNPTVAETERPSKPQINRIKAAAAVIDFEKAKQDGISGRRFSRDNGLPRSTLQQWESRKKEISAHPDVINFCESPLGIQFMHEIYTAALYEFNQCGSAGLRRIGSFIDRSPLKPFIASSYGALHKDASIMQENIIAFGTEQRKLMGEKARPKNITVCQDETFFADPCLVAMEPVSGFILLEKYSEKRDAETWDKEMENCMGGLAAKIIQTGTDGAKGLVAHAKNGLGVHNSPDLFHILREIGRATSPTFRAKIRAEKKNLEAVKRSFDDNINERDRYIKNIAGRGPGRPPEFSAKIEMAQNNVAEAEKSLESIQSLQESARDEVRGMSNGYHPIDLATGKRRTADDVKADLEERFENIDAIADELDLAEHAVKRIGKAKKLAPQMVATIAFFWEMVKTILSGHGLSKEVISFIYDVLIPLEYLKMTLPKASAKLRDTIQSSINDLEKQRSVLLDENTRILILNLARQCAEVFQRSSSCVEGRNGVLSLHHHAGRRLTPKRLKVLQVIHNFGITRSDGTTAAERFFEIDHPDLFAWVLSRQPLMARPRKGISKVS